MRLSSFRSKQPGKAVTRHSPPQNGAGGRVQPHHIPVVIAEVDPQHLYTRHPRLLRTKATLLSNHLREGRAIP